MRSYLKKARTTCFAIAVLLSVRCNLAQADCLVGNGFQSGATFKTSGVPELDLRFNQEAGMIASVFGVTPNMFFIEDGSNPNAFAAPKISLPGYFGTVFFGFRLVRDQLWQSEMGGHAVAGIMAHEFTHILQFRRSSKLSGMYRELHADYMAGYYLGRKSYFTPVDIRPFARSLFALGDSAFWSPDHHGTPEQRVRAMVAGFGSRNLTLNTAFGAGEKEVRKMSVTDSAMESDTGQQKDVVDPASSDAQENPPLAPSPTPGLPSGSIVVPCGCNGPVVFYSVFPNSNCQSRVSVALPCGGQCVAPNGMPSGQSWCMQCQ